MSRRYNSIESLPVNDSQPIFFKAILPKSKSICCNKPKFEDYMNSFGISVAPFFTHSSSESTMSVDYFHVLEVGEAGVSFAFFGLGVQWLTEELNVTHRDKFNSKIGMFLDKKITDEEKAYGALIGFYIGLKKQNEDIYLPDVEISLNELSNRAKKNGSNNLRLNVIRELADCVMDCPIGKKERNKLGKKKAEGDDNAAFKLAVNRFCGKDGNEYIGQTRGFEIFTGIKVLVNQIHKQSIYRNLKE